jgi:hypothetical protein
VSFVLCLPPLYAAISFIIAKIWQIATSKKKKKKPPYELRFPPPTSDLAHHFPGAYQSSTAGDFKFIRGDDVCRVMHYACTNAYPDIRHYMRQNVDRLVAHSNRVTACLALHQAGVNKEEIAYRLRWQPPLVRFYLRES